MHYLLTGLLVSALGLISGWLTHDNGRLTAVDTVIGVVVPVPTEWSFSPLAANPQI